MLRRQNCIFKGRKVTSTTTTATISSVVSLSNKRTYFSGIYNAVTGLTETSLVALNSKITSTILGSSASAAASTSSSSSSSALLLSLCPFDPVIFISQCFAPMLAVAAFGFLVRFFTLATCNMYSDRAVDRMATASPALQKAYLLYAEVAYNPHTIRNEIELSQMRLKDRRDKIMKKHHTSVKAVWAPMFLSGFLNLTGFFSLCAVISKSLAITTGGGGGAAAAAFHFLTSASASSATAAGASAVVGSSFSVMHFVWPFHLIAVFGWLFNWHYYCEFRKGFFDQRDRLLDMQKAMSKRIALAWIVFYLFVAFAFLSDQDLGVFSTSSNTEEEEDSSAKKQEEKEETKEEENTKLEAASTTVVVQQKEDETSTTIVSNNNNSVSPLALACVAFPCYFAGAAVAGLFRKPVMLVYKKMIPRARWPAKRPKLHGTYGELRWNFAEHLQLMRKAEEQSGQAKRQADNYNKAKIQIEHECDRRVQKMPFFKRFFMDSRYARPPKMPEPPKDLVFSAADRGSQPDPSQQEGVVMGSGARMNR